MRRVAIAALAAACLAGCGDDETTTSSTGTTTTTPSSTTTSTTSTESTTTTTEPGGAATAEDAARAVLTVDGTPKQACDTNVTTAFISISYGSRKNCLAAQTPDNLADSIEVVSSKQTETGVHLVVIPDGGPYDDAKVEVEVVERDGFRVDSLQAHVPAGP